MKTPGRHPFGMRTRFTSLLVLLILTFLVAAPGLISEKSSPASAAERLQESWKRAQEAGSYHFIGDVVQITIPTPKISNVGRPSRTEQYHLEGQSDLHAAALEFRLWSEGGSVYDPESGLAIRAADGKSYIRQGAGPWHESSSFTEAIAPEGDFMAFLAAARDITPHAPETRAGITFTRYTFQIDGPAFAAFVRNQMEAAMRARGKLPPGVRFEASSYYHHMTGNGELWVRENGLPLRQILNLHFPEQDDATVQAQIKVDFSRFGQFRFTGSEFVQLDASSAGGSFDSLWYHLQRQASTIASLLGLLLSVAVVALIVHHRRRRTVQVTLSLVLITTLLLGPLLNTFRLTTFLDAQAASAAEQSAIREEGAMLRELRAQDAAPQFDPHENPLTAAAAPLSLSMGGGNSLPSIRATHVLTEENNLDTDGDGLTNYVEQRIGTSEVISDSDGDSLSDRSEVNGFTASNQKWYLDPQEPDSNSDGVADTLEWDIDQNGQADDTDSDGIPNLFDDDNDNDGIVDRLDLAPFAVTTVYSESNPLRLEIKNTTGGTVPLFVDFQLRPESEEQLWYAFNLLDWPSDEEGQLRDVDFGAGNDREEMELLPMLEIRIPNGDAMLPPESELEPYQIAVGNGEAAGEKIAYVPLSLVTDQKSGERVAFTGRMRYLPEATWQPHSVRLVWMVHMANDVVCDPDNAEDQARGCTVAGYFLNQRQIVHRYYENWKLTGLTVKEDHGARIATIYEDPGRDPDLTEDGPTWLFVDVLQKRFITVQENGGVPEREVTIDNIDQKYDWNQVGSDVAEAPYGLPNQFRVTKTEYRTFDEAINGMSSVVSGTLSAAFDTAWQQDNSIKPLITYAYEAKTRSVGLDLLPLDSPYLRSSSDDDGELLRIDFHPSGEENTQIDTVAGFKWTPYCSQAGSTPHWDICDPEVYWQELEARHADQFLDPETLTFVSQSDLDPDVAQATMLITQLYALAVQQGISDIVQKDYGPGDVRLVSGLYASEDDSELESEVRSVLGTGRAGAKFLANERMIKLIREVHAKHPAVSNASVSTVYENMLKVDEAGPGGAIKGFWAKASALQRTVFIGAVIIIVAGTAAAAALAEMGHEEAALAVDVVITTALVFASVVLPIHAAMTASRVSGTLLSQVLKGLSDHIAVTQTAAFIGAAIAIGVVWGFFIYSMVSNDIVAFSAEFNSALAETIAATYLIILLTVLSLTVIGLIIVGIITAVDAILTLICEAGVDELRLDFTGGCFTLTAAATKVIAKALYNYELMINTRKKDLVTFGTPQLTLARPDHGYAEGNELTITLPITTHVVHKDPEVKDGIYINFYLWLFSRDNLRSSTFKFSATQPDKENITGVERDQITSKWFRVREDHRYVLTPMYGGFYTTTATVGGISLQAGLNQPAKFYQNMAFAVPAYECWLVPVALFTPWTPICYTRTFENRTSEPVETMLFDIFPATLNDFMTMAVKSDNGRGLGWDPAFRSLRDADGDGLRATPYGGLDPDDSTWDHDRDGLADRFELEQRQAGVNLSPIEKFSDGDGLTDGQELQFGTNPAVADSDNDGLLDHEEFWHRDEATGTWVGGVPVRINATVPFTMQVSSNPLSPDTDGDGVSDGAEYRLAREQRVDDNNVPYHPNLFNTPPVRIYLTSDATGNRYVTPGQQVVYTTTVVATTPLNPGVLDIDVLNSDGAPSNLLGPASRRFPLPFNPVTFSTTQTLTHQSDLTVSSTAQTGTSVSVNNTVRTQLEGSGLGPWQWSEISDGWDLDDLASETDITRPRFVTVAPGLPDRQDSYAMMVDTDEFPYEPERRMVALQNSASGTARSLSLFRSRHHNQQAGDIACNDSGRCIVVWEHESRCQTVKINSLKVIQEGPDGNSGIEPVILHRKDPWNRFDPDSNAFDLLWSSREHNKTNMNTNEMAGPDAHGFPLIFEYCDGDEIVVFESDNQDGFENDPPNPDWSKQFLAGRRIVPIEGFWNDTDRVVNILFDQAASDSNPEANQMCGGLDGGEWRACKIELNLVVIDSFRTPRVVHGKVEAFNAATGQSIRTSTVTDPFFVSEYSELHNPMAASNGNGFVVAWELLRVLSRQGATWLEQSILVNTFDANGVRLGSIQIPESRIETALDFEPGTSLARSRAMLDIEWMADRYRVTRRLLRDANRWNQVQAFDLNPDGSTAPGGPYPILLTNSVTNNFGNHAYDLAYDPVSDRSLLVYLTTGASIGARLFEADGTSVPVSITDGQGYSGPRVAYHSASQGWVVAWSDFGGGQLYYRALNADGTALTPRQRTSSIIRHDSSGLACPLPQSAPAIDLRFEELPGETLFADRSGYGNDATCSDGTCPLPGAPGAPNAPLSAYALEFDGGDDLVTLSNPLTDSFSLAFWYKANQAARGSPAFFITSNPPDTTTNPGFGLYIYNNTGVVEWWAGSTRTAANSSLNNGEWHFVTAVYNARTGTFNFYLDGGSTPVATGQTTQAPTLASTIRIGGGGTRVALDHLQIYDVALTGATVNDIFTRSYESYCMAAGAALNLPRVHRSKLYLSREEIFTPLTASAASTITVDSDAPVATVRGLPDGHYVRASSGGPDVLSIGGEAQDPTSGVGSVEVSVDGGPFQPAKGAESWTYQFAVSEGDHTIQARATDVLGHRGNPSAGITIIADGTPPQVTIDAPDSAIIPVKNGDDPWQVTLSGTAMDPPIGSYPGSGVMTDSVEVLLVGASGERVGDDWQEATYDEDSQTWTIDYLFPAARLDVTGVYTASVRAEDRAIGETGGNSSGATTMIVLDHTGPAAALDTVYATRELITDTITIRGIVSDTISDVESLEVAFTPVEEIAALPSDVDAEDAQDQLDAAGRVWHPASLAPQDSGGTSMVWSLPIPADLEGEYQIDFRTRDALQNLLVTSNVWRGIIDTQAPRLFITATATGEFYLDEASGSQFYEVEYECHAEDRYLNKPDFACPGDLVEELESVFNDDPSLAALFPDRTILEELNITWTDWANTDQPLAELRTCDFFGHCAAASTDQGGSAAQMELMEASPLVITPPGEPRALVVSPIQGRYVPSDGNLPVTIVAEAADALQEVTVELDGQVVATLTFEQGQMITRTRRTVQLASVSEGVHTVVAKATDWAGTLQDPQTFAPVTFTLDSAPPAVTIGTDLLGLADTWGLGSDILRFRGTASDSVGLAAVQIKIGDAPFVEAAFDESSGSWSTAQLVPDPEGRVLPVIVRAIDLAGQITDVTGTIGVDFSATDPPETVITAHPEPLSPVNSASFSFEGTEEASAFECRLDEGPFLVCASPHTYTGLSNGPHHFEVRAINDEGFVDPSAATFSWSVQVTELATLLDTGQAPDDPTFSREATFVFTGSVGVTGFHCSLDGSPYSPCSSPQSYAGLQDGSHTFLVRGFDAAGNQGAATRFTWRVENALPVAEDQSALTFRSTSVDITLTARDDDRLTYHLVDLPAHGALQFTAPDVVRYSPDSGFGGVDTFTFVARDAVGSSNLATVTVLVNAEPGIEVDPPSLQVQYSDGITPTAVTVTDPDSPGTSLSISSTSWTTDTINIHPGLPPRLSLSPSSDNGETVPGEATWVLSGTAELPTGIYTVTLVADDDAGGSIRGEPVDIVIEVLPEDVMMRFHGGNPRAVQTQAAGDDNSGPFELRVDVKELYPDNGTGVLPGNIALANVTVRLVPIGPGATAEPTGCTRELHDVDYDARLTVTCTFDGVPINTYALEVTVDGDAYQGVSQDVITIYDPSRGFTTGGGVFVWPGSNDDTSFGFTFEYNRGSGNVKGKLMVVARLPDGVHSIKSNALDGLALGVESDFAWASFNGRTTYQSPRMEQPEGNYTFVGYVEDHGEGGDRFWLQVRDKDGNLVAALSLDEAATDNAILINAGSIIVPR